MFGSKKNNVPRSSASVLFIFFGLVGTLLLATIVLNSSVERVAIVPGEPDRSVVDASNALPNTAGGVMRRLEIDTAEHPTTVLAYHEQEQQVLSLAQWDYRAGQYVLRSTLRPQGQQELPKLPRLNLLQTGWGNGSTIEVRWPLAVHGRQAVAYIQLDGGMMNQVPVGYSADGPCLLEMLESGKVAVGEAQLTMQDLDGDGVAELSQTITKKMGDTNVEVFIWSEGKLIWNEHWSQAMTARVGLFPEPKPAE